MTETPTRDSVNARDGQFTAGQKAQRCANELLSLLESYISRGEIAGCVTAGVLRGNLVHHEVLGWRDLEHAVPMTADTIFHIFSMTKPVTAVAVMILFDENRWSLDDPISQYLPEFESAKVFAGMDPSGAMTFERPRHAPTMRELMTGTAGFPYGLDFGPADAIDGLYRAAKLFHSPSLRDMSRKIAALPLAYQPGEMWRYGLSADLQGAIVECLTGQSLHEFMQQRIFEPLNMLDTAFHVPSDKIGRLATLYRKGGAGLTPVSQLFPKGSSVPSLASGGAGLVSTAADYLRFSRCLLQNGELDGARILRPETVQMMMANHLPISLLNGTFGIGHQRFRAGFGYGFNGAAIFDPDAAGVAVGRGTYQWDGAFGTWFWIDPENDFAFVGMIQRGPADFPPLQSLTEALISRALA